MGSATTVAPQMFVVDGFVIEAYTTITEVPYATISEHRGKATDQEREDELYGRCRICISNKNDNLLLCDECDRAFHVSCVVPDVRAIPKGEWVCARCQSERAHRRHRRAAAVIRLRHVLNDVRVTPSLPPKLQLKLLNIGAPCVAFARVPDPVATDLAADPDPAADPAAYALAATTDPDAHAVSAPAVPIATERGVPAKCRFKRRHKVGEPVVRPRVPHGVRPIACKKVDGTAAARRLSDLHDLVSELQPFVDHLVDSDVPSRFARAKLQLRCATSPIPRRPSPLARPRTRMRTRARARARARPGGGGGSGNINTELEVVNVDEIEPVARPTPDAPPSTVRVVASGGGGVAEGRVPRVRTVALAAALSTSTH